MLASPMRRRPPRALTAIFLLGLAVVFAAAAPSSEDEPRCHGRRATIVGTEGPDVLRGTSGRDVIWGGGGDDTIFGGRGSDVICGGPGADLIHGGRGNDLLDGGGGNGDRVMGDLGDDQVLGGPGNGDEVSGGLGIDTLNGGPGSYDLVHGDYGSDRMDGGAGGHDIASFATDVASSRGAGVYVSLRAHRARGDGHDRLFRLEDVQGSAFRDVLIGNPRANVIDGGPGDDRILGGGGPDRLEGGQGSDRCRGAKGRTSSCGPERPPRGSAYVAIEPTPGGGGGLAIVGGAGDDEIGAGFERRTGVFTVAARRGIALGEGCTRSGPDVSRAVCDPGGPARWLIADLGPGGDRFHVRRSLAGVELVRIAGGPGDDVLRGGPEDDLIEAGPGSDRLYGGRGDDGLVGGLPGPTWLYGGRGGDLLAGGGGCAGGALVGGPGRAHASFAETQAHPGLLYISLAAHAAWIDAVRGCRKVRLAPSDEDIEGSFDSDVLIGDGGNNTMLGQPGADRFYGRGGENTIDARDGVRDVLIKCGRGSPPKRGRPAVGRAAGRALTDSFDPAPLLCGRTAHGHPVAGLHKG
jgi:Ca2+-binding RTX toxin-like protein